MFIHILYILIQSFTPALALPVDSIGLKKINEKWFILHKMEISQTFFAVGRKYKIPILELKEANQGIDFDHIKAGSVLRVPYHGLIPEPRENITGKTILPAEISSALSGAKFHIVQPRQNLYRISLKYGVTVNQLKEWNALAENEIEIGQRLWISSPGNAQSPSKEPIQKSIIPETVQKKIETEKAIFPERKEPIRLPEKQPETKNDLVVKEPDYSVPEQKTTPPVKSFSRAVTESGMAVVYNDNSQIDKYYALHRTAPFGTVIMVRNPKNDALVYVKITGKLSDTGENPNLLIKVSQKSAEKLKFDGENGEVELSYIL